MNEAIDFMNNYIHNWAIGEMSNKILLGLGSILWISIPVIARHVYYRCIY